VARFYGSRRHGWVYAHGVYTIHQFAFTFGRNDTLAQVPVRFINCNQWFFNNTCCLNRMHWSRDSKWNFCTRCSHLAYSQLLRGKWDLIWLSLNTVL